MNTTEGVLSRNKDMVCCSSAVSAPRAQADGVLMHICNKRRSISRAKNIDTAQLIYLKKNTKQLGTPSSCMSSWLEVAHLR